MKTFTMHGERRSGKTSWLLRKMSDAIVDGKSGAFVTLNKNLADSAKRRIKRDYLIFDMDIEKMKFFSYRMVARASVDVLFIDEADMMDMKKLETNFYPMLIGTNEPEMYITMNIPPNIGPSKHSKYRKEVEL